MTTEEFTEEMDEVVVTARGRRDKTADETDLPVVNDDTIPLFQTIDKDARRVVTSIEVWRTDPPHQGVKGEVSPNADILFIANQFGNGMYEFRAKNAKGKVIRRETGIRVDIPLPPKEAPQQVAGGYSMADRLLDRQEARVENDMRRHKELADASLQSTQKLSMSYAEMMRADALERSTRDREYFAAQQSQQQNFFQTLLVAMQTMHNQSMETQRESFNHTLQVMQASNAQTLAMSNPTTLLALFKEGLEMGQGSSSDDPVVTAIKEGGGAIKNFATMMKLQNEADALKLKAGQKKPAKKPNPNKRAAFSRAEALKLIRLKEALERKGYDFENLIDQVSGMYGEGAPDESDESTQPDDLEPDTGDSDVDDRESSN